MKIKIDKASLLVLAGSEEQLSKYDEVIGKSYTFDSPAVIIGGGRVGKAIAEALDLRGIDYRVVENNRSFIENNEKYILGSAADLKTLMLAGINKAPSIFITTHNDDINIYLTIYCRR